MKTHVAFNIFASDLILSFHIVTTYLPIANSCKSTFRPGDYNNNWYIIARAYYTIRALFSTLLLVCGLHSF